MYSRSKATALFASIFLTVASPSAWALLFSVTDLGNLGGSTLPPFGTHATGLNDNGDVVGYSYTGSAHHAFHWNQNSGMHDLGTLSGTGLSSPYGVNNAGQVVGYSSSDGGDRAFIWSAADGMRDLGTLPDSSFSQGVAINASGQVAGRSITADGGDHATFWDAGGNIRDLGTLPNAEQASALSINNAGEVAGFSGDAGFFWSESGGMQDLGSLGAGRTLPTTSTTIAKWWAPAPAMSLSGLKTVACATWANSMAWIQ